MSQYEVAENVNTQVERTVLNYMYFFFFLAACGATQLGFAQF